MVNDIEIKIEKAHIKEIKKLYKSAFPSNERAPFFLLKKRMQENICQFANIYYKDNFVGFFYLLGDESLEYIFYFAIEKEFRHKGIGSTALQKLNNLFKDKKLFLAMEPIDPNAPNIDEREARLAFYESNGYSMLNRRVKEGPMIYELLGLNCDISKEEYNNLIYRFTHDRYKKYVGMID